MFALLLGVSGAGELPEAGVVIFEAPTHGYWEHDVAHVGRSRAFIDYPLTRDDRKATAKQARVLLDAWLELHIAGRDATREELMGIHEQQAGLIADASQLHEQVLSPGYQMVLAEVETQAEELRYDDAVADWGRELERWEAAADASPPPAEPELDFTGALALWDQVRLQGSRWAVEAHYLRGWTLERQGDVQGALSAYGDGLSVSGTHPLAEEMQYQAAGLAVAAGQLDAALSGYRRYFEIAAEGSEVRDHALYEMGRVEYQLGESVMAFQHFGQILGEEDDPLARPEVIYAMAEILYSEGDLELLAGLPVRFRADLLAAGAGTAAKYYDRVRARDWYSRALAFHPDHPSVDGWRRSVEAFDAPAPLSLARTRSSEGAVRDLLRRYSGLVMGCHELASRRARPAPLPSGDVLLTLHWDTSGRITTAEAAGTESQYLPRCIASRFVGVAVGAKGGAAGATAVLRFLP